MRIWFRLISFDSFKYERRLSVTNTLSFSTLPCITLDKLAIFGLPRLDIFAIDLPFKFTTQGMQTSSFDKPRLVFAVPLFFAKRGKLKSL